LKKHIIWAIIIAILILSNLPSQEGDIINLDNGKQYQYHNGEYERIWNYKKGEM